MGKVSKAKRKKETGCRVGRKYSSKKKTEIGGKKKLERGQGENKVAKKN